ncbi:MAG: D-aminoacylase [Planctomycetota bacterium]|nr:D-aminoacylase [Planctomycetota bacterium]MDA1252188.1 D-aminoacylase [Planctomycetota bacterium]
MKSKPGWLTAVAMVSAVATSVSGADFDLVIRGGRVVDGSGNPWRYADVAVKGDRVVAVGRVTGTGEREFDAKGLVVSPGFIDIHSHSDFNLLQDGHAQSKIRQGVTTEVLGEGSSAGPYQGRVSAKHVTVGETGHDLTTLGEYFDLIDQSGVSVNVASYVGIGNLWRAAMGDSFDRPDAKQRAMMKRLLDEAVRDGALGLSSQVMMPPGSLATVDDVSELCTVVAKHGAIYSTHIRNEGTEVFDAVKEAIEVGRRTGVPVDIIHLKIADEKYWGRMNEVIALIEAARNEGLNIQANVYPYTRGNNNLDSIIPPWAHEGGREKFLARLKDRSLRARLKRDIRSGIPGWYNHFTAVGGDWSRMLISANSTYRGLTMDRVLVLRPKPKDGEDDLDQLFDLLIDEGGSVSTVYAHHTDRDMTLALSQPWCSVGSDGSAYAIEGPLRKGNPHPRNFGTFPRVLGVYVRELKLLRLEDAVRKMTSLNAAKVGLKDRGLLQPGAFADITVFDPETIIDNAKYTEPFQYNEGIRFVFVNGQLVLDGETHTGAKPGRALRRK